MSPTPESFIPQVSVVGKFKGKQVRVGLYLSENGTVDLMMQEVGNYKSWFHVLVFYQDGYMTRIGGVPDYFNLKMQGEQGNLFVADESCVQSEMEEEEHG